MSEPIKLRGIERAVERGYSATANEVRALVEAVRAAMKHKCSCTWASWHRASPPLEIIEDTTLRDALALFTDAPPEAGTPDG